MEQDFVLRVHRELVGPVARIDVADEGINVVVALVLPGVSSIFDARGQLVPRPEPARGGALGAEPDAVGGVEVVDEAVEVAVGAPIARVVTERARRQRGAVKRAGDRRVDPGTTVGGFVEGIVNRRAVGTRRDALRPADVGAVHGEPVTRCSRLAAPKTVPTSTDMRSSRLLSASPPGGSAGGACACATTGSPARAVNRSRAEGMVSRMTVS